MPSPKVYGLFAAVAEISHVRALDRLPFFQFSFLILTLTLTQARMIPPSRKGPVWERTRPSREQGMIS